MPVAAAPAPSAPRGAHLAQEQWREPTLESFERALDWRRVAAIVRPRPFRSVHLINLLLYFRSGA